LTGSEKVLLISSEFPPGPGGIGNHAFNLAKYLNISGIDTEVLTVSDFVTEGEAVRFDERSEFSIRRHARSGSKWKTYIERISEIRSAVNSGGYSHVIFSGMSSLLASLLVRKDGKKFISIAHGGDVNPVNTLERKLVNKALQKSDLIIPVSNFSASKITAGNVGKKMKVIPNGFDLENIGDISVPEKSLNPGTLRLISVGTVWPRKGHHNVLRILPELRKMFPSIRYDIIGRKADMSRVNEMMTSEIEEIAVFHGQADNQKLMSLLNESDIFILLSETQKSGDFEGFGIAVIEGNFFRLPAIGSRNSGLEDAISNNYSGMLVDPSNDREIISAVEMTVSDYGTYSRNAREWAMKHHWSNIIKSYINELERISA
jgi:glycosyltransferase involved in cell wall biosynthesis